MDGYGTRVTLERTGLYGELAVTAHNLVGISSVIAAWEVRGPSSESVPWLKCASLGPVGAESAVLATVNG